LVKPRLLIALLLTTASAAGLPSTSVVGKEETMPATADDVESVLERVGTEDRKVTDRLTELTASASRVHALMLVRARSYVRMARAGLLPIGGGLDALVDHASRLERLRRSLARDLDQERRISEERIALSKRRESLEDRRSLLESEHAALARSHIAIEAAEDRESAFRSAFLGSHESVRHTAIYGSAVGPLDPTDAVGDFASLKGRLPFPMEGRVEIRPARKTGSDGPRLEMVASLGAVVRAVSAGRVAFADTYAEYGRAVIVDHGSGYYTVSGNLSTIDVEVGSELRTGDRLGTVGTSDQGPVLYFEIRRGAQTINAAPWFGI
jgi:murein hydrolase activator